MIEQFNIALFNFINHYAGINPLIDSAVVLMAQFMPIVIIIGLAYLWVFKGNLERNIILYSVYAAILGLAINLIIGMFYFHPRPFMIPLGTQLFPYPVETSFPSDHTTAMVSVAFMFIFFKETRKIGLIFLILGLIGGFSRVFCGVHFPMDVLGSVVVSLGSGILIYSVKDRLNSLNNIIQNIYSRLTEIIKPGKTTL